MSIVTPVISDLTRGELSPRMEGKTNLEAYYQGVAELLNMFPLPQGGGTKRPGTMYFAAAQSASKASRLIPFVVDESTPYLLELYDGGIRIISKASGNRTLLTTVYTLTLDVAPASDWHVGSLLTGQTSGVTCRVLKKNSGTEWIVTAPSGSWTDAEIVRGYDIDGNSVDADQNSGYPTDAATTVTSPVYAYDSATFYSEGELFNVKYVQVHDHMIMVHPDHPPKMLTRMADTGWIWAEINFKAPEYQASAVFEEVNRNLYRIDKVTPNRLRSTTVYPTGEVREYSGSLYRAVVDIAETSDPSTEASKWEAITGSPGTNPFGAAGDYPRAVGYFQDRLIFGGTANAPNGLWGSGVGQYEFFVIGPADNDPWNYNLNSERSEKIQWIAARETLVVGTTGSEWNLGGPDLLMTPTQVYARRQTTFGSTTLQAKLINENVIFVQKGGRKIREYFAQNELQAYRAEDLTFFSNHITEGGLKEFGFQADPDPIVWFVRNDGLILTLTYDKTHNSIGWARHVTDGEIESFAIVPNGDEDEIWVEVKRTIDGSTVRYLEYFAPRETDAQRDRVHADCALVTDGGATFSLESGTAADPVVVTATGHGLSTNDLVRITDVEGMTELEGRTFIVTVLTADTFELNNEDGTGRTAATAGTLEQVYNTITGLSHLEGEEVAVTVDGGPSAERTVSSGQISLATGEYGNTVIVGLPFTARMKTMNILAPVTEAKTGRISAARLRFLETVQALAGSSIDSLYEIIFRASDTPYGEPTALFTGEKRIGFESQHANDQRVVVESSKATPLTVALILPEMAAYRGGR